MKIAALYDIHGNLPALEAVLEELEEIKPDAIVVGGDVVSGPMPRQTLERLLSMEGTVHFIRGNGEREVVMASEGHPLPTMSEQGRQQTQWVADQLTRSQRVTLSEWPEQITLPVDGWGDVLFCHATPRSDEEIFTPLTPQERLNELFADIHHKLVLCGHTHIQFERQVGHTRIVNAGSIGMPYADEPGAYWLLLRETGYEFRHTKYDLNTAAQEIRESQYPEAIQFAEENVFQVPTAKEATEFFEYLLRQSEV